MRPGSNLQNNAFDKHSDFLGTRTESLLITSLQHLQQELATPINSKSSPSDSAPAN